MIKVKNGDLPRCYRDAGQEGQSGFPGNLLARVYGVNFESPLGFRYQKNRHGVSLGDTMRVFKNKWFNHWSRREGISDQALFDAAKEIVAGKVEADLGSYLFKKRLAMPGQGKSGGYRIIVGHKRPNSERIVFLSAFAKTEKGNLSRKEEAALALAAGALLFATDQQVNTLLAAGAIWEIFDNE